MSATLQAIRNMMSRRLIWQTVACMLLVSALTGCAVVGWVANAAVGETTVQVEGQYFGLNDKTLAVVVYADEFMLYEHPGALLSVARAISSRLVQDIPGARVTNPDDLVQWQRKNAYWRTLGYAELIRKLNVERIVLIDLVQYTLHEPGDAYVLRGNVVANVGVIEAPEFDGSGGSGEDFAFHTVVRSIFPRDNSIGLLEADPQSVELGTLADLSQEVSGLFHDYTKTVHDQ